MRNVTITLTSCDHIVVTGTKGLQPYHKHSFVPFEADNKAEIKSWSSPVWAIWHWGKGHCVRDQEVRFHPQTFSYSLCPGEFLGHQPPYFEACGSSEISLLTETDPPQATSTILQIRRILRRHLIYTLGPSYTHAASVCCGVCALFRLHQVPWGPDVCSSAQNTLCTPKIGSIWCNREQAHMIQLLQVQGKYVSTWD